jgi:hypothetical protein
MPLVERKTESKTKNFSTVRGVRTLYVAPGETKPGDVVVEPTKRQLAELVVRYPEEYGKAAKAAGVAAPTSKKAPESHDVDDEAFTDAQEEFLALSEKKAIAFIKQSDDAELLGHLLDAEKRREKGARGKVVNAFRAKRIGAD